MGIQVLDLLCQFNHILKNNSIIKRTHRATAQPKKFPSAEQLGDVKCYEAISGSTVLAQESNLIYAKVPDDYSNVLVVRDNIRGYTALMNLELKTQGQNLSNNQQNFLTNIFPPGNLSLTLVSSGVSASSPTQSAEKLSREVEACRQRICPFEEVSHDINDVTAVDLKELCIRPPYHFLLDPLHNSFFLSQASLGHNILFQGLGLELNEILAPEELQTLQLLLSSSCPHPKIIQNYLLAGQTSALVEIAQLKSRFT